jgi:hypothetical protein
VYVPTFCIHTYVAIFKARKISFLRSRNLVLALTRRGCFPQPTWSQSYDREVKRHDYPSAFLENKHIYFCLEKRSSLSQRWRCSCKFRSRGFDSWQHILKTALCLILHSFQDVGTRK